MLTQPNKRWKYYQIYHMNYVYIIIIITSTDGGMFHSPIKSYLVRFSCLKYYNLVLFKVCYFLCIKFV